MNDLLFTYPSEVKWGSDVARVIISLGVVAVAFWPNAPFYFRAFFGIVGVLGVAASVVALRYGIAVAPRELEIRGAFLIARFYSRKETKIKLSSIDLIQDIRVMDLWSQYTIEISSRSEGTVFLVGRYLRGLRTLISTIREHNPHCIVERKFRK